MASIHSIEGLPSPAKSRMSRCVITIIINPIITIIIGIFVINIIISTLHFPHCRPGPLLPPVDEDEYLPLEQVIISLIIIIIKFIKVLSANVKIIKVSLVFTFQLNI